MAIVATLIMKNNLVGSDSGTYYSRQASKDKQHQDSPQQSVNIGVIPNQMPLRLIDNLNVMALHNGYSALSLNHEPPRREKE